MSEQMSVVIVGGGIVGCGLARTLSRYMPKGTVVVLEKADMVGSGATKANSGIVHAGTDSSTKTLKGRLVARGNKLIHEAVKELHFGFKECGGLVVAQTEADIKGIDEEWAIGTEKGIPMERWDAAKIQKEEPTLSKELIQGLFTPTTSVINPYEFCFALALCAMNNGVDVRGNQEVVAIHKTGEADHPLMVECASGLKIKTKFVVNAAGVYAGKVSEMVGITNVVIKPRKGEEYLLDKSVTYGPSRVVHPVPTPTTKGVLLIPTVDKTLMVGPSSDEVTDYEDTATSVDGCSKVFNAARKFLPSVHERDIIASFAGLRACAMPGNDFIIEATPVKGFIQAAGIQSPGLTCALSIAEYLVEILKKEGLEMKERADYRPEIQPMPKFFTRPLEDQIVLAKNPLFTKIVCRCEVVTEGDIHAAIDQGANTLDGVKLRTRAGCGRCQGGFCTSRVMEIMSERLGISVDEVRKNVPASRFLAGSDEHYSLSIERPHVDSHMPNLDTKIDVIVIGGGPAGLAAAVGAKESGAKKVVVLDRESHPGGILLQCIHSGFGLAHVKEELTGPEYADACYQEALVKGVEIVQNAFVLQASNKSEDHKELYVLIAGKGLVKVEATTVVLAMGARERTRAQIKIPGNRPAGVMTAGLAQKLINCYGKLPGKRCVILGSGDIGLIMARRLSLNGVDVQGVYEVLPTCSGLNRNVVQCLHDFNIPLHLSHTIVSIHGKARVTGVTIAPVGPPPTFTPDLTKAFDVECDTVLLSVGLIPENELSVSMGVKLDMQTRGALVSEEMMTSTDGVFACGNVLHVHDLADNCWDEGKFAGHCAGSFAAIHNKNKGPSFALQKGEGILYCLPQNITLPTEPVTDDKKTYTISCRVNCSMRQSTLKIAGGAILEKKMNIALPGEMIRVKIPVSKLQAWAAANADVKTITVAATGTVIPKEELKATVCIPAGTPPKVVDLEEEGERHYICLCCPNGCPLTLTHKKGEVISVTGNKCKRGDGYARQEFTEPKRVFSMTIPIANCTIPKIPVKLSAPIPKQLIQDAAKKIMELKTTAPIKRGDVIIKNLLGIEGVNVLACRTLEAINPEFICPTKLSI